MEKRPKTTERPPVTVLYLDGEPVLELLKSLPDKGPPLCKRCGTPRDLCRGCR